MVTVNIDRCGSDGAERVAFRKLLTRIVGFEAQAALCITNAGYESLTSIASLRDGLGVASLLKVLRSMYKDGSEQPLPTYPIEDLQHDQWRREGTDNEDMVPVDRSEGASAEAKAGDDDAEQGTGAAELHVAPVTVTTAAKKNEGSRVLLSRRIKLEGHGVLHENGWAHEAST
jgi:hypothetical protein